jgi:hypothetical protein
LTDGVSFFFCLCISKVKHKVVHDEFEHQVFFWFVLLQEANGGKCIHVALGTLYDDVC